MTTKKSASKSATGDGARAQDPYKDVYTAHQVHTIANLTFQRMAGGWRPPGPWMVPPLDAAATAGAGIVGWPPGAAACPTAPGVAAGTARPVFYWYP
jgi:hypothetical protein